MTTLDNTGFLNAIAPLLHQLGQGTLTEASFKTQAQVIFDQWDGSNTLSNRSLSRLITNLIDRVQNTLQLPIDIEGSPSPNERVAVFYIGASGTIDPQICGGRCLILPSATWVLTIKRWPAVGSGWVNWGTITVATDGTVAVSIANGQLVRGDLLAVYAPSAHDATAADFHGGLSGSDVL